MFKNIENQKIAYLSVILFLIIGSYWFIGLIKDTVFFKMAFPVSLGWPEGQGRLFQPIAKFISPIFILGLVLIYSKLVDLVKKENLFYILGSFFFIAFFLMGIAIFCKSTYGDLFIGKNILALTGWLGFFITEAYGSLMIVLFWSFVVNITSIETAQKGFPIIISFAQVGGILGSLLTIIIKKTGTVWPLYFIGCFLIALIMIIVKKFCKKFKIDEHSTIKNSHKPTNTGFLAGIKLLFESKYLLSIFIISTFYEIGIAVVDYQMKSFLDISKVFHGEIGFSSFHAIYGASVNTCALIIALCASRILLKRIGASKCLLIYPIIFAAGLILIIFSAITNFDPEKLLWLTFAVMVVAKGLTYGLNNPSRDIMYIPTSTDAKFKTKSFTETFGSRSALMAGASISNTLKASLLNLAVIGSMISLGFVGIWLIAALYLAKKFKYTHTQ